MRVPFLSKNKIAETTREVIQGYQDVLKREVFPPIPVEDIIERYLKLDLGYFDFFETPDMKDVFGATYIEKRLIAINESLLSDKAEGRLCFTCAHEAGHWVLHRDLVGTAGRTGPGREAVFCREKDARTPAEWQADYFAACLLMPEKEVKSAFRRSFGDARLDIHNIRRAFPSTRFHFDLCVENWRLMAEAVMQAGNFSNVSKQAVIIRLQDLGLLVNHTKEKMTWTRPGSFF